MLACNRSTIPYCYKWCGFVTDLMRSFSPNVWYWQTERGYHNPRFGFLHNYRNNEENILAYISYFFNEYGVYIRQIKTIKTSFKLGIKVDLPEIIKGATTIMLVAMSKRKLIQILQCLLWDVSPFDIFHWYILSDVSTHPSKYTTSISRDEKCHGKYCKLDLSHLNFFVLWCYTNIWLNFIKRMIASSKFC